MLRHHNKNSSPIPAGQEGKYIERAIQSLLGHVALMVERLHFHVILALSKVKEHS